MVLEIIMIKSAKFMSVGLGATLVLVGGIARLGQPGPVGGRVDIFVDSVAFVEVLDNLPVRVAFCEVVDRLAAPGTVGGGLD